LPYLSLEFKFSEENVFWYMSTERAIYTYWTLFSNKIAIYVVHKITRNVL
jgi:hypothetical protein